MNKLKQENYDIQKQNQNDLRELEQFYVDGTVSFIGNRISTL